MKIFDTLSQKKKLFKPQKEIGMYVCGPTVYDVGHLGHARAAVAFDVIRRYFLYKGFPVKFVSNITDVDDKIIRRAAEKGIAEDELVAQIIPEYEKDYGALRVMPPTVQPRATAYIPQMVALTEHLVQKGAAYTTEDGVYFEVKKYKKYGELSGQRLSELRAGARIAVDEKKKNPEDFALWKAAKPGEPAWEGPLGMRGRPGWHIECSAMSADILGETFDIHGGGIDLKFPHHEDERAQSEMATGKTFARFWLHNGHIQINKEKMSKSLGNFFTIKDILAKWNPLVVRYFLLSTHYRMPIEFSEDLLEQAKASLSRLKDCYGAVSRISKIRDHDSNDIEIGSFVRQAQRSFEEAMDDDFEISRALAALFDLVAEVNRQIQDGGFSSMEAKKVLAFFNEIDAVFGVLMDKEEVLSAEVPRLIAERNAARTAQNFSRADEIRKELEKKGILLEDLPSGTVWKRSLGNL